MRSFQSGWKLSCLDAVLLSLFLSAPASIHAQSGSSSQPSQSSGTASQSQSQGSQACSQGPPILKRGKQADLPPCPDEPDGSASGQPAPARSQNPAESLIERARDEAFEFSEKLPNFICDEYMTRNRQQGRDETRLDVVSAEVIYGNGQESYRNVKINDRPTDTALEEIDGSWSTGEFASTLLALFSPSSDAHFQSGGATTISGQSAEVYDFQVRADKSHWMLHIGSQSLQPAYDGSVWIDPKTARVLRIEMQADNLPSSFPMDTVESAVDYSFVSIGGMSFLLPVHAESLGCQRGISNCNHNVIDFRNYHEFKVDVKIGN